MDQLPELVKEALSTACKSCRPLSWKLQENSKGALIQLVWKAKPESGSAGGNTTRVGSNWKSYPEPGNHTECSVSGKATGSGSDRKNGVESTLDADKSSDAGRPQIKPRKRIGSSRARRNARRLQAFLDRKRSLENHTTQRELESLSRESGGRVCRSIVNVADGDRDLKSYLDNEVSLVEFSFSQGEPAWLDFGAEQR